MVLNVMCYFFLRHGVVTAEKSCFQESFKAIKSVRVRHQQINHYCACACGCVRGLIYSTVLRWLSTDVTM